MTINRWAAKADANQARIVAALRRFGCSVEIIGRPVDLLVGLRGRTWLLEVKDGTQVPSARKLTPTQLAFFAAWRGGRAAVVESVDEALAEVAID